ncbi:MAG: hypothetical protein AMQ74_01985 [Candidatus Methanofastidiosum methylothiophilum]|uniref:Uncharacterized protein n=1 Tax=Candidatus Methanofastidiosum methylothiophilum TaxID=1705564 RepID=A0A150IH50_9EURY|nr:MAG: hypothetical protein AMQ74_01985 [Candidatus Methanofastidiosum methylthiophilus]
MKKGFYKRHFEKIKEIFEDEELSPQDVEELTIKQLKKLGDERVRKNEMGVEIINIVLALMMYVGFMYLGYPIATHGPLFVPPKVSLLEIIVLLGLSYLFGMMIMAFIVLPYGLLLDGGEVDEN